jgi:hypothetical protein
MQSLPQGSMMRFGCSANWASITRIDAHERLAHPDILVLADQHRRDVTGHARRDSHRVRLDCRVVRFLKLLPWLS